MKIHLQKPTKRQVLRFLRYTAIILLGNAITAAASALFIVPNDFTMGGTTGLGIFVRNMLLKAGRTDLEWAVSFTVYAVNIIFFLLGAIFLGKRFALATLAGTLLYPTFLTAFTALYDNCLQDSLGVILQNNPGDKLLLAIIGSLMFGAGIGLCVRVGASTGGTDIPPLILHKFFNIPVSVGLWVLDMAIVFLQLFATGVAEVLYGVVITLLSSVVVDLVSPIGKRRVQVKIISRHYREIREMILNKLNRGVTMLYGRTGFLQEKCFVLLTIVTSRDLVRLKNEIYNIDPEAFLMISTISEVRGRGFSSDRIVLPLEQEGREELEEVSPTFVPPKEDGQGQ